MSEQDKNFIATQYPGKSTAQLARHASIETTMRYYVGRNLATDAADLWKWNETALGDQTEKHHS